MFGNDFLATRTVAENHLIVASLYGVMHTLSALITRPFERHALNVTTSSQFHHHHGERPAINKSMRPPLGNLSDNSVNVEEKSVAIGCTVAAMAVLELRSLCI